MHLPTVLPALECPRRDLNPHSRRRRPALCPLSYTGHVSPAGVEPALVPGLKRQPLPVGLRGRILLVPKTGFEPAASRFVILRSLHAELLGLGALDRSRTCNLRFRKPVRYPLRYKGIENIGGTDGSRTRMIQDHNLVLCPLSYRRRGSKRDRTSERGLPRLRLSKPLHYRSAILPLTLFHPFRGESRIRTVASCLQSRRSAA